MLLGEFSAKIRGLVTYSALFLRSKSRGRRKKFKCLELLPQSTDNLLNFFVYIEGELFSFEFMQVDRWISKDGNHALKAKGGGTYTWTSSLETEKYRHATLTLIPYGDLALGTKVRHTHFFLFLKDECIYVYDETS